MLDDIIREHCLVCKESPDGLGEIMRAWAFPGEGYGCYSTFDVRPEFVEVTPTEREFRLLMGRDYDNSGDDKGGWGDPDHWYLKTMVWFKHPNGIEVGWLWDGDGVLTFYVPELADDYYDGTLTNSDCKKDHDWHFGERR